MMRDPPSYEHLETIYHEARKICDPVEYALRQQKLLHALASYILERDDPDFQHHDDE